VKDPCSLKEGFFFRKPFFWEKAGSFETRITLKNGLTQERESTLGGNGERLYGDPERVKHPAKTCILGAKGLLNFKVTVVCGQDLLGVEEDRQ